MSKKCGLTREQHIEIGEKVRGVEAILRDIWSQVVRAYPAIGNAPREAEKAYRAVERLRVTMDGVEYRDSTVQYAGSYIGGHVEVTLEIVDKAVAAR